MKKIAVSAWPPRKSGVISASPTNPPSGSTSSLIMVASSADFTRRNWGNGKRRMWSNRAKRSRRSIRSPIQPFMVLIWNFTMPLATMSARNISVSAKR